MITTRTNRLFDNCGLHALFIYYFASLINDAVVALHGFSGLLTPRQFAILFGIVFLAIPGRVISSGLYRSAIFFLSLFLYVLTFSYVTTLFLGVANQSYVITIFSSGLNIVWLIVVGRVLSEGLSERDKVRTAWGFVLLGLIPLLTGLYEISQGQHILRGTELTSQLVGSVFWVRGFHLDKINYVTALAPPIFASFLLIPQVSFKKKLVLAAYLGAALVCVFQSFSVTGILGIAGGLTVLLVLYGSVRIKLVAAVTIAVTLGVLSVSMASERGEFLKEWYRGKYERNLILDRNPRYVVGAICVREFLKSPIWGLGAGRHIPLIYQEVEGWEPVGGGNAHSIVSVPADLGLLGAGPFLLFWAILFWAVLRPLPRRLRLGLTAYDRVLRGLCVGLSVFVAARLLLYFHSMADEAFILLPALVFAVYAPIKRQVEQNPDEPQKLTTT